MMACSREEEELMTKTDLRAAKKLLAESQILLTWV